MITAFLRIIKFAVQNFWRNIWLSVVTVSMLVLTLVVVNVLVGLQVIGSTAVKQVEQKVDLTVAFQPEVNQQVVGEVRTALESLVQVVEVTTVSPDEALIAFRKRHQNNPHVTQSLDEVGGNPFGYSLTVRAGGTRDYEFIMEALQNPTYSSSIEDTTFVDHQTLIARITTIVDRLRTMGVALAGIFAAIAILIIFNTIRVAIYTYREEIGIMKLVGASNWFVRMPFLLESIFYGILAIVITAAIVYPVVFALESRLAGFFNGTTVGLASFFTTHWFIIFGSQFLALVFLNMVSASIAMGRYLKI